MTKKLTRLLAFLMALAMAFSCAACGNSKEPADDSSEAEWEYEDVTEWVDANGSVITPSDTTGGTSNTTSKKEETAGNQQSGTTNQGVTTSTTSKKTNSGSNTGSTNSKFLVNPEDYRGTTVKYATWKDPKDNEDGPVIEAFQKKYGITVKADIINQEKYLDVLSTRIGANNKKDIPDVFFENGTFPGSLSVMQPLDNAMINFKDAIWNQNTIKASTIDGHPYLVDTISNIWAEVDICVYNKQIFKELGLTTPEELYNQGKWTFETMRECAKQVAAKGKDYIGVEINSETALGAAGCGFFDYKDGKITVSVNNDLYEVMNFLAQMKKDGYAAIGHRAFDNGKVGIGLTNCFALKTTGYLTSINPQNIGVVPLPTWKNKGEIRTGIYRGWGLVKGAQNPVAAGIFLREYLDINNYNVTKSFHNNKELSDFFFRVTGESKKMTYYYGQSMVKSTALGTEFHDRWSVTSPDQMKSYIEGALPVMDQMAKKANEIIETERKWLKKNYK